MISQETIQEATRRLVDAYKPLEIYLFGSYAWGKPDEESDIDLLIVVESSDEKMYKRGYRASDVLWELKFPKHVMIFTKQEFDNLSQDVTTLCHKIKNLGTVLYARP